MKELICEVSTLIDQAITFKRIAGNTIILYFNGRPGDPNVKTLWIDPPWRYEKNGRYIIGSQDFPWEPEENQSKEDYRRSFEELCNKTDGLVKSNLVSMQIGQVSNDLYLEFTNQQIIRTMMICDGEEGWIYRDRSKKIEITAFADRLEKGVLSD